MTIEEVIAIAKTLSSGWITLTEKVSYNPSPGYDPIIERVCEIDWSFRHGYGNSWEEALRSAGWKG